MRGTGWAAIDPSTYNWYSIRGSYNENSKDGWRAYSSYAEATDDFGDLIANSAYYFKNGKYTVKEIAPTYCSEEWGDVVISYIGKIYIELALPVQNTKDFLEGGVTNEQEAEQLNEKIEGDYLSTRGVTNEIPNNSNGPFATWWRNDYNTDQAYQCTWWAWGRASQYLESIGSKYSKYPETVINGGDYYDSNMNNKWFRSGKTPKVNSVVSWSDDGYGHVSYVEGVTSDGAIYISHAAGNLKTNFAEGTNKWKGVTRVDKGSDDNPYSIWGYTLNGFIYLDEPIN